MTLGRVMLTGLIDHADLGGKGTNWSVESNNNWRENKQKRKERKNELLKKKDNRERKINIFFLETVQKEVG